MPERWQVEDDRRQPEAYAFDVTVAVVRLCRGWLRGLWAWVRREPCGRVE